MVHVHLFPSYIYYTPYVATHVSFCLKEKSDQAIHTLSPQTSLHTSIYLSCRALSTIYYLTLYTPPLSEI